MNIEIKFRTWDKKKKEFCYKFMISSDSSGVPIQQFTGLKDNNKKEMYDGDILMYHGKNKEVKHPYNLIFWHKEKARWALKVIGKKVHPAILNPEKEEILGLTQERLNDFNNEGYYEIVSNIYENPELINNKI